MTTRRFSSSPIACGARPSRRTSTSGTRTSRRRRRTRSASSTCCPRSYRPARQELVAVPEQHGRLARLPRDVVRVRAVERMEALHDRRDVRRHARATRRDAVLLPRARAALLRRAGRMLIAALRRVEAVEAVTEGARRVVRHERVLALPAGPVRRVERVEIDQPAEAVGRRTVLRRAEAVHRLVEIRVAAEEALEAAAVHPVSTRSRAAPQGRSSARPRASAATAARSHGVKPRLGSGRCQLCAAQYEPSGALQAATTSGERRPVIAAAAAGEARRMARLPAAGVVDLELDLLCVRAREGGVDRAPDKHVLLDAVAAKREERLPLAVRADLDARTRRDRSAVRPRQCRPRTGRRGHRGQRRQDEARTQVRRHSLDRLSLRCGRRLSVYAGFTKRLGLRRAGAALLVAPGAEHCGLLALVVDVLRVVRVERVEPRHDRRDVRRDGPAPMP